MFSDLVRRLTGQKVTAPLPELDAGLAMGALMVRLAKADRHYAFEEIAHIDKFLAEHFGLNPVEAAKMRTDCTRLEAEAPETKLFTDMVTRHVTYQDRVALYNALWQISMADQSLSSEEEAFLADAAKALAITADDIALTINRSRA